jgi:gamma-glutamylcyclotransferase (GGCT)/AIG2-like uncharacterized protein YtfP
MGVKLHLTFDVEGYTLYYFAYGSNMSHQQMRERCPSSEFVSAVFLQGYKFVYDGWSSKRQSAVANIIASENEDIVWGGLFGINEDNLAALDCYEGYPTTYDRKEVQVKDRKGRIYTAWVYSRMRKERAMPSKEYRNIVVQGAHNCNLPKGYIESVLLK